MMQQSATNGVPPPMPPQQYQPPQQWGQQPPPPQVYHPQAAQHPVPPPMWNQQPPPQVYQPQVAAPPPQPQPQPSPAQYGGTPQQQQPASADEIRTLWIGDLQFWVDENYINSCFAHSGEVISVKVIRNKQTSQSEGYGFIEFATRAAAERVLQTYNGTLMPNTDQNFRLNWATLGSGEKRDDSADHTIFVGDLAADVTDYLLQETFRTNYPSVKGAKVVTDRTTGRSKGYGFVKFGDESEQLRAMTEMNGQFCSTRQMRIGPATSKNKMIGQQQYPKASYQNTPSIENENDPNNTTIFVGGLDTNVTEDYLKQVFSQFGQLVHVKIPVGKRCGFVQFANRACAEEALLMLNGKPLGGQNIRLSWGRSPANKQPQAEPNQWNGGYYGYNQGYEAYSYAPAAQDPNMYAYGAYPAGYGSYQQQPQQ